jgi:uncharacterized protein (DUF1015 family)
MATIRPFRALRPAPGLAPEIAALPYDVMTSAEAREMAKNKPRSFLRVDRAEINLDKSVGVYDDIVYETAAARLSQMEKDGELIQDAQPMFYIYRLTKDGRTQTGLVACASIDEYVSGAIKKHEHTTEAKERDRSRHVSACDANTGPIFLAYRSVAAIDALVGKYASENEPRYDFVADDGVRHEVWAVADKNTADALTERFAKVPALYIADGHHRAASAVRVGLGKRELNPGHTGGEEYNYFLSVIFPDNQLMIMDYNRVVKSLNGKTRGQFLTEIAENFEVEKIGREPYKPRAPREFGMYSEGEWLKLTARDGSFDASSPVSSLDAAILQNNLLAPTLGIVNPRADSNIDFVGGVRGLSELSRRADGGEAVAFALYPTSMRQLEDVADAGLIMPPKSTWFEPKLRSGLFIHKLGE